MELGGKQAHDANVIATMLAHGVGTGGVSGQVDDLVHAHHRMRHAGDIVEEHVETA